MRKGIPLAVSFVVALSGCLTHDSGELSESQSEDAQSSPAGSPSPTSTRVLQDPPRKGGPNETSNETSGTSWPDLRQATIRPGVQVEIDDAQCTSNFVFKNSNNSTLYLGLAAHCVDGLKLGDPVEVEGAIKSATLAYSSWLSLNLTSCPGPLSCGDPYRNDFALLKIDAADRGKVHPALLHFGGPTGLANSTTLKMGDRVLSYGNSGLRGGIDETNRHEGIVVTPQGNEPDFEVLTIHPGVSGDSGSAVMTREGKAVGILSGGDLLKPGTNIIVGLQGALELAQATAKLDVELATWTLLDDGLLP